MTFSRLAIIGPGLLGGSIALAFRARNPRAHVSIWARREEAAGEVMKRGIADVASTDLKTVVQSADLVIFCVPIGVMAPLAEKIAEYVTPETLVTDVGSVKAPVVASLGRIFAGRAKFIGSHPMAGSEQAGIEVARPDLFEGAVCILTPEKSDAPGDIEKIRDFWAALGCVPRTLSAGEHDEVIALVSHLPHLLAATLVNLVCAENPNSLNFCGNGFRDTTRVASGPPEMWTEIFGGNRAQLKRAIEAMIGKLKEVAGFMDDDAKMREFLTEAKSRRDDLKKGKQ